MLRERCDACVLLLVLLLCNSPAGGTENSPSLEGRRRSLSTGTFFCVALQNADPAALQAGLNWVCGQGEAVDCSPIQPTGPCYKQNNLAALASYAYNEYYQKSGSTGRTCSFNGTATITSDDPSSGSCVFEGSSNSSVPSASPPTTTTTPPFGSSPPSTEFGPPAAGTTSPPSGFGPPSAGFNSPPSSVFGPPAGSATFGPSSTLNPYGAGGRHVASSASLSALSAIAVVLLLASTDLM